MNKEFMIALSQLEQEKEISKEILLEAIEASLISAYKRIFHSTQNVRVAIDDVTGEIKVWAKKVVVLEVQNDVFEIALCEAEKLEPNIELNTNIDVEVTPADFGRIAAQTAKQVVAQRIREAEKEKLYNDFSAREGELIIGVHRRSDSRNYFIDLGKIEAVLPFSEVLPGEKFAQGARVKAYLTNVESSTRGPKVFLSRTHPDFLKRLFELEVPEIEEGIVEIISVTREPGYRAKIAVSSNNTDVDPVGACVGYLGNRVQAVVNELRGEKIDVVRWSDVIEEFVANSLGPTKVSGVSINDEVKTAHVTVPDNQLSLAIGRDGQNARLAARLTNWKIDIKSETESKSR
ncbi:MAG: transcription termination/antitermination protein NusA [Bacillota bacterium]|jgi:N utilization substance protein A